MDTGWQVCRLYPHEKDVGNLWVQPLDGDNARQLTDFTLGDMYYFAFSSDGTRPFVARGEQISDATLLRNYRYQDTRFKAMSHPERRLCCIVATATLKV